MRRRRSAPSDEDSHSATRRLGLFMAQCYPSAPARKQGCEHEMDRSAPSRSCSRRPPCREPQRSCSARRGCSTASTAAPHAGWQVLVDGDKIAAVGPDLAAPAGPASSSCPATTLMPGMIEGHGHLFLHPYNETSVGRSGAARAAGAAHRARGGRRRSATLLAGFTSERDLGTEGAGYADVGLKQAIDQGIVPGPRLIVATRAIVARGAYGPKGFEPGVGSAAGRAGSQRGRRDRARRARPDRRRVRTW